MKEGQPRSFVEKHEGKLLLVATLATLSLTGILLGEAMAREIRMLESCIVEGAITQEGNFIKPGPAYDPAQYPECHTVIEASKVNHLRFYGGGLTPFFN